MTHAVRSRFSGKAWAPRARIGAALAASALAHALLLSAPPDLRWRGAAPGADGAPMTVRLAPAPVHARDIPASPEADARQPPLREKWGQGRFSVSTSQTPGQKIDPGPIFPPAPDPHYYAARDLDGYPRPLTALRIDGPPGAGGSEVRLELLIDERGIVREVSFAGVIRPGGAEEELRAMLAATRFLPAVKDGRAVRSRILLSLKMGSE